MYDARTVHGREVLARVVEAFGDKVFHTVIARTVRFPETTVVGEPITSYASRSSGAAAYRQLAKELIVREESPGEPHPITDLRDLSDVVLAVAKGEPPGSGGDPVPGGDA